jgi:hypothetical protein
MYFLLLPLSLAATLSAWILAPILPLFASRAGWLPYWLAWFQTPDNPIYGDAGHLERWGYAMSYAQAVVWLARNPAYGFEWSVLAIAPRGPLQVAGDPWIRNRDNARAGIAGFNFRRDEVIEWRIGDKCCHKLRCGCCNGVCSAAKENCEFQVILGGNFQCLGGSASGQKLNRVIVA